MTLKEYYQSLEHRPITPKQQLRKSLMDAFGVTEMTISRWMGRDIPPKDKWDKISDIVGIPVEELFADAITVEKKG